MPQDIRETMASYTGKELVELMRSDAMDNSTICAAALQEAIVRNLEMLYKITEGAH